MTEFQNIYEDQTRARAYSELEFPGTYYLAFRDIPLLLATYCSGTTALDFGCGTGRSTRFLRDQGYDVIGADISPAMLREAARIDPNGRYILLKDGELSALGDQTFDVILCAFTFDNIPDRNRRIDLFRQLKARLRSTGRIVNLVSSPEIYVNEWLSFSTRDFPENKDASSGSVVRITMLDVPDRRPVEDVVWSERDYAETFAMAGLEVVHVHRPLGIAEDGFEWVSEGSVAPWTIYVLSATRAAI